MKTEFRVPPVQAEERHAKIRLSLVGMLAGGTPLYPSLKTRQQGTKDFGFVASGSTKYLLQCRHAGR